MGTEILSTPSNDVFSAVQTIPFAWNFYGTPVSSYLVSDNGYITFETAASTSDPVNGSIPSTGGPNNAIYSFWDDLGLTNPTGIVGKVRTSEYGIAPNRVHVIQWISVTPAGGSGFLSTAIRLYECGDFDIVHSYANASVLTGTVGCENATGTNGTMAEGPNFDSPILAATGNDQFCKEVLASNGTSATNVNVVVEEVTSAWCGWCVDG